MKVFDNQAHVVAVGQRTADFAINSDLRLSGLEGFPVFFVFWKSL